MVQAKQDIPALTGIRGIAALTVVIVHILIWRGLNSSWHLPTQWPVEIFFVLSGFVMSMNYLRPEGVKWRAFFAARFGRVYPLFILTTFAMGAFYLIQARRKGAQMGDLSAAHWLQEITLSTAMPIIGDGGMWNDPSWSISVEAWVYVLIFPVVALIATRRPSPFVVACVTTLGLALFGGLLSTFPAGDHFKAGWMAFGRGALGFLGGWGAYGLYNRLVIPGRVSDLLCVALLGAMIAVNWAGFPSAGWLLLPFYPIVVLGLTNSEGVTAKLMATRPIVFLGEISYSVYLMHALLRFAIDPVLKLLGIQESVWAWLFLYIPVVIGVSTLTYMFFEKPARDMLRKLLAPRSRPKANAAQASF